MRRASIVALDTVGVASGLYGLLLIGRWVFFVAFAALAVVGAQALERPPVEREEGQ